MQGWTVRLETQGLPTQPQTLPDPNCRVVRPYKLNFAVGWGSLRCMMPTCPRSCSHSLATVSLLPPSDFIKIWAFFCVKKMFTVKKRAFPNCRGGKKKSAKAQTVPTKRLSIPGKKKDTLLNTIKETKPANASSVTCTALRLTSWIPSACGYHLALLYQLRLRVLSRVWALKPFPSWPASIKTETCRVGGLWLTSDHLLGHSN